MKCLDKETVFKTKQIVYVNDNNNIFDFDPATISKKR